MATRADLSSQYVKGTHGSRYQFRIARDFKDWSFFVFDAIMHCVQYTFRMENEIAQEFDNRDQLWPNALSFIDIFAGCGGLSLGLMQAGWKGMFAIEHDRHAFQTLYHNLIGPSARYRFDWPDWLPKDAAEVQDVLQTKRAELRALSGTVDMLVGGPPCQGFSNAGKRNPSDPRNKLVEAYLDFVRILKPRVVLLENVRGITSDFADTSASEGKTNYAAWLIEALSEDHFTSAKTIDTSQFGVPQKRQRYFVLAFRRDLTASDLAPFDIIERMRLSFLRRKRISTVPVSSKTAISDLEVRRNGKLPSRESRGFEEIAYSGPLTSYQSVMNLDHDGLLPDTRLARHGPEIEARFQKIIELCHADGRLNTSLAPGLRASLGLKKCAIRVMDPDRPSPTVTSMPDDLIHYCEPRTLTVRENARLQGFPDWFAFQGNYTSGGDRRNKEVPRFTQVANAVPPLVAEAFGVAIADMLSDAIDPPPQHPVSRTDDQANRGSQEGKL